MGSQAGLAVVAEPHAEVRFFFFFFWQRTEARGAAVQ